MSVGGGGSFGDIIDGGVGWSVGALLGFSLQ